MRLILLFVLVGSVGCDLGTYSKRYNDRVGRMSAMANTNKDLSDQLVDVGGGGKLRLPLLCYHKDSMKFDTKSDFTKARLPGIEIPGFRSSYMGDIVRDDRYLPFQAYIHYVQGGSVNELKEEITQSIQKVLTSTSVEWTSERIEAYSGTEHVWHKAKVTAGLPFLVFQNDAEKSEQLSGRMDFYLTASDAGVLIVIFRAPSEVFGYDEETILQGTLMSIQGFN